MNSNVTVSAPLRNRIRVHLSAQPPGVWRVVGDLQRFPEYSSGLEAVDVTVDEVGRCIEYVCHFRQPEPSAEPVVHRETVTWYEADRGFASNAEEPNVFGLERATTLVELEPFNGGTMLTWAQYFDAEDVDMMRAEFERALADISSNLVSLFGGTVVERTGRV